uniref:Glutathionylspermidine synthase pre-ATP-grasp-like domain-containing protein n=1 Tax=Streptomyces sp. NBC_00049 TaxID=2903617 RepID=A0AAU2JPZ7_9ACTN
MTVNETYLRRSLEGDRGLLDAVRDARLPDAFENAFGKVLLPRPFFVPEAEIRSTADDLAAFFELLFSMPDRLYGGALGRYCEALGIDRARAAVMSRLADRPALYGRADLSHDGQSFKLFELNVGSSLGGTDRAELARTLLEVPAFAAFAEEHGIGHVHTGERLAEALREISLPLTGGAQPVVAYVEANGGLAGSSHLARSFEEMMNRCGIDLVIGEIGQIEESGSRLRLHGRQIDVVLRYFTPNEIVDDPDGPRDLEPVLRAHEEGRVVLWTTPQSALFGNKGAMALMSDPRMRDGLSEAQTQLIDRILPWTRLLTPELVDHCRAYRTELILKPTADYGGAGIVAGWDSTEQEWKDALDAAARGGFIVQRRVGSRPEQVVDPGTGEVSEWTATWGLFLLPSGYAGSYIRALEDSAGVVRAGTFKTTTVFHTPDPAPRSSGTAVTKAELSEDVAWQAI